MIFPFTGNDVAIRSGLNDARTTAMVAAAPAYLRSIRGIALASLSCVLVFTPGISFGDDDTGLYFGVSASRLSADFEDQSDSKFDDSDTAGGLQIGYMLNNLLGFEAGYTDLGSYSAIGSNPGNNISLDADAFSAALILNFNALEDLDVYAKAGAFRINASSNSRVANQRFNVDEDSTEAFGAIGLKADLGAWNFFGEVSKIDTDVSELSIDIVSLGIRYEFGY